MNKLKNINGENNKIIFKQDDGTNIEDFSDKELELINNFDLSITGNNNTVTIKVAERADIEKFLSQEGLLLSIVGNNDKINIGKDLHFYRDSSIGTTGLKIFMGMEPDEVTEPTLSREINNCEVSIGDRTVFCGVMMLMQEHNSHIKIGKDCMFSWGIDVWCTDVHTIMDLKGIPQNYGHGIDIADHVWVGKDVKVSKNTQISSNSVVGWNSVVTRKFEESNVIIAGNPAKIIKHDINWDPRGIEVYKLVHNLK